MHPFSVDDLLSLHVIGDDVADPRTHPQFDGDKGLVLAAAEVIAWTGRAQSTRATQAAGFWQGAASKALFTYDHPSELVVTSHRTVFRFTTIPQGASKAWVLAGAAGLLAGKLATGLTMRNKVVAGQIRHVTVAGIQTEVKKALIGVKDRYIVLHSLLPGAGVLTMRMLVKDDVEALAPMIATVVASDRLDRQAEWLEAYPTKASKLTQMRAQPTPHQTPGGAMYGFPLVAMRGRIDTPFEVIQERT